MTTQNKKLTLDEVCEMFRGKGGDPESENVIVDNNTDKKDGFVTVWGNKADIAKLIDRTKPNIIKFELVGNGVQLYIDRKAFRGIVNAFKTSKVRKPRKKKEI